jgi:hypothetical protein
MIKRFRWVRRRHELSPREFEAKWADALANRAGAGTVRVAACTAERDVAGPDAAHDGASIEWFADLEALLASEQHLPPSAAALVDPGATLTSIAEERVLRGADWLAARWAQTTPKFKHMALARRADHLTPAEFSDRWRTHAGRSGAREIPAAARGLAYVQNHPIAHTGIAPAYDAINEVYFDDLDTMQPRIEFFRHNDVKQSNADLVREAHFLILRECVIYPRSR